MAGHGSTGSAIDSAIWSCIAMTSRFDLWTWPTPNGRKVTILLEELSADYSVHPIDIRKGAQFDPAFLALNPNNKIPVLRDNAPKLDGGPLVVSESGAILMYLAEDAGAFLPEGRDRWPVMQWLMFQMGGVGPMHGQANHFCAYIKEPNPYGADRYRKETERLYHVCDNQLSRNQWLAGDTLSIADFAVYPWAAQMDRPGLDIASFPNLDRWFARLSARPGVARGMAVLSDLTSPATMTDEEREIMFGDTQFKRWANG